MTNEDAKRILDLLIYQSGNEVYIGDTEVDALKLAINAIDRPIKAYWRADYTYSCSNCFKSADKRTHYCPNCGSEMENF